MNTMNKIYLEKVYLKLNLAQLTKQERYELTKCMESSHVMYILLYQVKMFISRCLSISRI